MVPTALTCRGSRARIFCSNGGVFYRQTLVQQLRVNVTNLLCIFAFIYLINNNYSIFEPALQNVNSTSKAQATSA